MSHIYKLEKGYSFAVAMKLNDLSRLMFIFTVTDRDDLTRNLRCMVNFLDHGVLHPVNDFSIMLHMSGIASLMCLTCGKYSDQCDAILKILKLRSYFTAYTPGDLCTDHAYNLNVTPMNVNCHTSVRSVNRIVWTCENLFATQLLGVKPPTKIETMLAEFFSRK